MLDFSVTFIITIINITILFFILKAVLFKPVTKFMAARAARVQASIDQAENDRAEAKKMLTEYEGKLKKTETEAIEIIKTARENAAHQAEQLVAEGKSQAENIIAAARRQIETERQAAVAKLKIEAAALVVAASSKLMARELSGDDNRHYVNMLLDELALKKGLS
jgi:F-type H+-transporting ATPase subunit b